MGENARGGGRVGDVRTAGKQVYFTAGQIRLFLPTAESETMEQRNNELPRRHRALD